MWIAGPIHGGVGSNVGLIQMGRVVNQWAAATV